MTLADLRPLVGVIGLRVLAGLAIGMLAIWIYRWIRVQSRPLAVLFVSGFLLRAFLGIVLFWISYLNLPFLSELHQGNGFWQVAPDARGYMAEASRAAIDGLHRIRSGSASPAYVTMVALWMRLVGISPMSGMFLNLMVYGLLCALLVYACRPKGEWRADLPLLVLLFGFSFSPVLIVHGSQSLKDDLFAFLNVAGALGALAISTVVIDGFRALPSRWMGIVGPGMWLAAVHQAAGIRAYFSFFMWSSLTAVLAFVGLRWQWDLLVRRLPLALLIVSLTGVAYIAGAGPYDKYAIGLVQMFQGSRGSSTGGGDGVVASIFRRINGARLGFQRSGGATNIAPVGEHALAEAEAGRRLSRRATAEAAAAKAAVATAAVPVAPPAPPPPPPTVADIARQVGVGLGTLFVPISLLKALGVTNFSGGRGLLVVTDIDTLFVDATILASLALLYLRWDVARRHLPYVCFLLLLGCATTVLLAYVVTNFGTQFRLRMLAVVPFWLLLVATVEGRLTPRRRPSEGDRVGPPAPAGSFG